MFPSGGSWKSRTVIVCSANIVADGGVFSPRIGFGDERRILDDSLKESRGVSVVVPLLAGLLSGEVSRIFSVSLQGGVVDLDCRSGDRSGVRFPSRKLLISRTLPV